MIGNKQSSEEVVEMNEEPDLCTRERMVADRIAGVVGGRELADSTLLEKPKNHGREGGIAMPSVPTNDGKKPWVHKEPLDEFLDKESDRSALDQTSEKSIESLKRAGEEPNAHPLARAYAKGIPTSIATDTMVYLKMPLEEIAEEWCLKDPVDLLTVLARAYEKGELPKC